MCFHNSCQNHAIELLSLYLSNVRRIILDKIITKRVSQKPNERNIDVLSNY